MHDKAWQDLLSDCRLKFLIFYIFMMVIYETSFGKHICIWGLANVFGFFFRIYLDHGDMNFFYKPVAILLEIRVDIDRKYLILR